MDQAIQQIVVLPPIYASPPSLQPTPLNNPLNFSAQQEDQPQSRYPPVNQPQPPFGSSSTHAISLPMFKSPRPGRSDRAAPTSSSLPTVLHPFLLSEPLPGSTYQWVPQGLFLRIPPLNSEPPVVPLVRTNARPLSHFESTNRGSILRLAPVSLLPPLSKEMLRWRPVPTAENHPAAIASHPDIPHVPRPAVQIVGEAIRTFAISPPADPFMELSCDYWCVSLWTEGASYFQELHYPQCPILSHIAPPRADAPQGNMLIRSFLCYFCKDFIGGHGYSVEDVRRGHGPSCPALADLVKGLAMKRMVVRSMGPR